MLFSELPFLPFFAGYLLLHLLLPADKRIYLIIVGGSVFYAWWRLDFLWVPYALTLIAFLGVRWMIATDDARARRRRFAVTLVLLFAPLAVVKYAHFFAADVIGPLLGRQAVPVDPDALKFALPLGISFITFTVVAYVADVYRRRYPPERWLGTLLAYVLFFPHLIAGPILRPHELMPQLKQLRRALDARFLTGAAIFTLGLVKKLVFADQLAAVVEPVYAAGAHPTGVEYVLAIYGFSAQIYCDFSGYTDMAIGLAYILRIRLPTNFLRPYGATSVVDFWRRWHITLSHWLRDYLYIPLGGSRLGRSRQIVNLMITMVLGGLWHGASWTFVIWGFIHGAALSLNHLLRPVMRRWGVTLPRWLALLLTFHFVTLAWVYFRAPDLATAHQVLAGPFLADWSSAAAELRTQVFPVLLLVVLFGLHRFDRHALIRLGVRRLSKTVLLPILAFCIMVAFVVSQGSSAKFIYFDF
jgi:alginate O-acetyltransferase complex protein AlgI